MALEITLAGEVTIRADGGEQLPLRSARARVAFALLTLERAQGVTRDLLADAVWPGQLPRTWGSALRTVVSEVRAFVSQVLPPGSDPVLSQGGRYRLQLPDDVVVDVEQAESGLDAAQAALTTGTGATPATGSEPSDVAAARQLALQAIETLRAPFLPDHDADWVVNQQDRLGRLLVAALETASQAAAEQADGAAALAAADEAIERAPLRESAHRCRMAAHVAAGNRAEALRAYQQLRRVLADELGADPAPETEAAYLTLLGAAPAPAAAAAPAPTTESTVARPTAASTAVPLVGRDVELARLNRAWETAAAGSGQVALVTGDTGIGKTRLAVDAAHRVSSQGGLVLLARCERDAVMPYQPFVELLDGFVAAIPDDELPRLDPLARAELAAVFPSFSDAASGGRDHVESARLNDRAKLFDAVANLLLAATRDRPVAVVLDDLRWADTDTQLLLRHLLRRSDDAPLLVVAVARDPGRLDPPLADTFRSLERDGRLQRLELDGLDEIDVRALVEHFLPEPTDDVAQLTRRLLSDTSGNPFMLMELLRGHRSAGTIPPAVQDLVTDKLEALERPAVDLLRAAAVAGTTFELDLVASAADLDELDALDALDAAVAARLVTEVPAMPADPREPRHRFTHEIVPRTLYGQLTSPRRRHLHGRLADAVERRRADRLDGYAPLLARHRSAAAGPAGDRRAVEWSRTAAIQANRYRAAAEAARLYGQALQHVPADDAGLRAEVLGELGATQVVAGDPAAEQNLLDAALQARRCARPDVAAWASLCVADLVRDRPDLGATAATLVGDVLGDVASLDDAGDAGAVPESDRAGDPATGPSPAPPVDPLIHARLLARYVQLAPPDTAVVAPDAASGALTRLTDHLLTLGWPDQLDARQVMADDLAALASALDDPVHRAVAEHHQATISATLSGGPTHAEPAFEGGGTEMLQAEHEVAVAVTQGRLAAAQATVDNLARLPGNGQATPLDRHIAPPPGTVALRQLLVGGWLRQLLGGAADAPAGHGDDRPRHRADDVLERAAEDDLLDCPAEQALLAVARGQLGPARLTVRAVVSGSEPLPGADLWLHACGVLGLAAVELHDPALATATHDLLAPYAGLVCGVGYRSFVGTVTFHLGRLAAVAGDHAEAERHLVAALQQHSDAGARPWIALTQQALADVLEARGRPYERDWIGALRSESQAIARTLH